MRCTLVLVIPSSQTHRLTDLFWWSREISQHCSRRNKTDRCERTKNSLLSRD